MLDVYVKPTGKVIDHLTEYSGITKDHLEMANLTLADAQVSGSSVLFSLGLVRFGRWLIRTRTCVGLPEASRSVLCCWFPVLIPLRSHVTSFAPSHGFVSCAHRQQSWSGTD
jgi:hypothetical protein